MNRLQRVLVPLAGLVTAAAMLPAQAQSSAQLPAGDLAADLLPPLTVVADHGGEPARPYYVAIGMAGVPEEQGYALEPGLTARAQVSMGERDMLPVESERLSPGRVDARSLELPPGTTPFFLIGDDDLSLAWLEQRGDILRELYAVGLVVDVADAAGLERLRHAAQELELRPMPGDDLAGRIGLAHYPVLITATGLEQ